MAMNPGSRRLLFACAIATVFAMTGCTQEVPPPAANTPAPAEQPAGHGDLTALINSAPLFDTQGNWGAGYALAKSRGGPGVVVGPGGENPNVFAQQFSARPGEPFKLVARASSFDGSFARARLQINWIDAAGKFISVSSKVFDLAAEERELAFEVFAPAATAQGILYVVADGDSVVRYTEMRLLGDSARAGTPVASVAIEAASSAIPRPADLTPLDRSGKSLTPAESQYYFYQSAKTMQRKAREQGMDFILYVMPDEHISVLMPAIVQLRAEGIKVLAYSQQGEWPSGVDEAWYWQKADSHWTEAAARLTADELLQMWKSQRVENRPFSTALMQDYGKAFPTYAP